MISRKLLSMVVFGAAFGVLSLAFGTTIADAGGSRRVLSNDVVVLNGSNSQSDAGPLSYSWIQLSGPTANLTDPSTVRPAFIAPATLVEVTLSFQLTVDAGTETATASTDVIVRPQNAPLITSFPEPLSYVGTAYAYFPSIRNGPANWTLVGPPGASVDPSTGAVQWVPAAEGNATFELSATTGSGQDSQSFVVKTVALPAFVSTPTITVSAHSPYRYDGDGLPSVTGTGPFDFYLESGPSEVVVRHDTGEIVWTPTLVGTYGLALAVQSPYGKATQTFSVTVYSGGAASIKPTANAVAVVGVPYVYDADSLVDVEGVPPVKFKKVSGPTEFFVDEATGFVAWLPARSGDEPIILEATNPVGSGPYAFTVSVTEATGSKGPTAVLLLNPSTGKAPLAVDADGTQSQAGDAPLLGFALDFGDGSPPFTTNVAKYTYLSPGGFNVRLQISDVKGMKDEARSTALVTDEYGNVPPSALIVASERFGRSTLQVSLQCDCTAGTAPIAGYRWEYGDGDVSTEVAPTHTYSRPGGFRIRLLVIDENGLTGQDSLDVEVTDGDKRPPLVHAYVDPVQAELPYLALFGSVSGGQSAQVVKREWEFSNGQRSTQLAPTHRVSDADALRGTITVTDENGLASSDTVETAGTKNGTRTPRILSTPVLEGYVGVAYSYDDDGKPVARGTRPLTWELGQEVAGESRGKPDGMSVDATTGALSWFPREAGSYEVWLTARNPAGYDVQRFTVEVTGESSGEIKKDCSCSTSGAIPGFAVLFLLVALRSRRFR